MQSSLYTVEVGESQYLLVNAYSLEQAKIVANGCGYENAEAWQARPEDMAMFKTYGITQPVTVH